MVYIRMPSIDAYKVLLGSLGDMEYVLNILIYCKTFT